MKALFLFPFAFLTILSSSLTDIQVRIDAKHDPRVLTYTVYDHSHVDSIRINVSGRFHEFKAVQKAIQEIAKAHADWCGFALKLAEENVTLSWTDDQRTVFRKMIQDYSCLQRAPQGFYGEERPPTNTSNSELSSFDDQSYIIVALSIVLSNTIILVVVIGVAYAIMYCCAGAPKAAVTAPEDNAPAQMLLSHFRTGLRAASRQISSTASLSVKKIQESVEGDTTVVEIVDIPSPNSTKPLLAADKNVCSLCTCNVPVKLAYSDVLILEQFMRADGTVLPREHTGLCKKQQLRVERCVMEAHWAGLFPDRTIPDFDRAGYKRFNRYWNDDMSMYKLKQKTEDGTWYYIKRYNSKGNGTYAKKAV